MTLVFVKCLFPQKEFKPYYMREYPDVIDQHLRKQWEIYQINKPDDLFVYYENEYHLTDTGKKFIDAMNR